VGCKWIFKNKFNVDGSFERHKARSVVKGLNETKRFDYTDTFNPSVKPTTMCMVLTRVIYSQRKIHRIDVYNVFLNGDMKENVYVQRSLNFVSH